MNNSFDINILVNGNRCKQYHHEGKTFIEAKHGSEYELEIKNNTWRRILALTSVDGLSVLTGTTATEDDPGYVIPSYSPLKIKGWRHSNNEVGAFKFTTKGNSYAHSQDGCEASKNCGVIGFKLYYEVVKPVVNWNITWSNQPNWRTNPWDDPTLYCNTSDIADDPIIGDMNCCNNLGGGTYSAASNFNKGIPSRAVRQPKSSSPLRAANFDMGSTWGQKVESKVVETDFEKGALAWSIDIYYSSRQSLIDMGVPINVGHQVSFPQSFPNKYATPPSGWRG